jgi:hypothetical protein
MSASAATSDEIRKLLREARSFLTPESGERPSSPVPLGPLKGTLEEFDEFLEHNELELAWDALADSAARSEATAECWHKLAQAAKLMRLPAKESLAAQRTQK